MFKVSNFNLFFVCFSFIIVINTMAQDTMHGHIIDRSKNDCDFESFLGSTIYPGLFEDYLDASGKPVYKPSGATPVTCGPTSFSGWFYETDESMMSCYDLPMERVQDCDNVFKWESKNPAFHPIDNQLGGNEGFAHNFHFTLHLEADFFYERGQTIQVTADDDLWVYIDGRLALDMGGVHPPIMGALNLDMIAEEFGLVPGTFAKLDIFFAERHAPGSTLNIEHNLEIIGSLH